MVSLRRLRAVALVLAGYYLSGRLGLLALEPGRHISLIWLPAGVALAAFLRLGREVWPGVAVGSLLLGLTTGTSPAVAMLVAAGNTLAPLAGATLLRRSGLHPELDRRRDLALYVSIGIGAATAASATNGVLWLAVVGRLPWSDVLSAWAHWWLGDAIGTVVAGIPLLTLSRASLASAYAEWRWVVNLPLSLAALLCASWVLTATDQAILMPLWFVPHMLLFWLSARSGLFAASATTLVLAGMAALAAGLGVGPYHLSGSASSVAGLSGYLCSLLAVPLLMAALTGELAASERRWQRALDTSDIGIGEWDLRAGRIAFSARWLAMLGDAGAPPGASIQAFWSRVHPSDAGALQQALEPLQESRAGHCRADCRMRCSDGAWRWFELHALVAERDALGKPLRIVTTLRDVDDRHVAHERQRLSESLFEHLHEGLLITDAEYRVLDANPTFEQITGYGRDDVLGTVPALLRPAPPDTAAERQQLEMQASLAIGGSWRGEVVDRRRNGEHCTLQVTVSVVRSPDGRIVNHVLALSDVTEARRHVEQLQRQAHFDELTRLPNRVRLAQMLQAALRASEREASLLTVCYLDLDHFKPVNDRYGHEAGDRLLVELASRMRRSLRSWAGGDDVVARIGGDEFVLLLRTATLEESRHAVERVLRQISQPYVLGGAVGSVAVTASIGATVFPLDGADAETLLRHADHAMYGAKQAGRNGYLFFDAEHDRRAEARFMALGRVQEALDAGEFCLYFQPKVDMRRATVVGVEALLRWRHPEQGVVSPAQFLPLIENTGLGISVGNWVFQQGIRQLAQWLRDGFDLTLSINVSARHLQEPLFAEHLAGLLHRHPEPVGQHLVIEVLETTALADIDYTCELMRECRSLGVRFALDDFGTGYSTLTYLKRLPLDMLKIDRSFVTNMLHDRQDLAIVEGVIGLSQTFGCTVVAEGVETPEQAERLIAIGCDIGQGNGIAAAMPAPDVPAWVRGFRGVPDPRELAAV
ncbi:MAG: EAL domain-containing protein [Proteobacteria bacterium]|nr:EAL domain-containing protein [Pseudomonadota bacterium]